MSEFSDKLFNLRKERKLTQQFMADELNICRDKYSQWERGLRVPSVDEAKKLCEILGCDMGYLMGEHPDYYYATQDIRRETGLSAAAVNYLIRTKGNSKLTAVIDTLLIRPALIVSICDAVFGSRDDYSRSDDDMSLLLYKRLLEFLNVLRNEYEAAAPTKK